MMGRIAICSFIFFFFSWGAEDLQSYIEHHMQNAKEWHLLPFHWAHLPLPSGWIFSIRDYSVDMSPTLHAAMLALASIFLIFFFVFVYKKQSREAPRGITNAMEAMVLFVRDEICIRNLGDQDGRKYSPLFLTLFFFILFLNYISLIPGMSTATANINVTAAFASVTFLLMIAGGLWTHGPWGFMKLFVPHGVPLPLVPVIFFLEFIGLFIKAFALTIRLFANMLAGHTVIFSLLGLVIAFKWFGVPAIFLALFIYLLELLVAFLQAYIFTVLSAMFVGSMLHPAH